MGAKWLSHSSHHILIFCKSLMCLITDMSVQQDITDFGNGLSATECWHMKTPRHCKSGVKWMVEMVRIYEKIPQLASEGWPFVKNLLLLQRISSNATIVNIPAWSFMQVFFSSKSLFQHHVGVWQLEIFYASNNFILWDFVIGNLTEKLASLALREYQSRYR